ncbi:MAG: disulfide bond formation protein DsbC [Piscirickettsiaceae bacterium]|nr:MAG: disulfide bond formation protein DsbC [Piscirickettsiaceae bacterium]PCI67304.1 MAG: disulfide bond formation protein DsbC [Piscirickettsiaceae bacterium]
MNKFVWLVFVGALLSTLALADKGVAARNLAKAIPGVTEQDITTTPISGLYQVTVGARIIYASEDGRYIVQGEMVDLSTRENLTENASKAVRKAALGRLNNNEMIIFPAKSEKHQITVFSDIDCGYCRKLHAQLSTYTDAGITVKYLFFPRSGVNTESYHKAVSVWCADDRNQALTDAKLNNRIVNKTCNNPVTKHMEIARSFGVTGTPSIILDNGTMIPGYVPAHDLLKYL